MTERKERWERRKPGPKPGTPNPRDLGEQAVLRAARRAQVKADRAARSWPLPETPYADQLRRMVKEASDG